jgi:hypothetical protein
MAVLEICQINQENSASRSMPYKIHTSKEKDEFLYLSSRLRGAIYMILSPPGIVVAL